MLAEKYIHLMTGLFIGAYLNNLTDVQQNKEKKEDSKPEDSHSIIYQHPFSILLFYEGLLKIPQTTTDIQHMLAWAWNAEEWKRESSYLQWGFPELDQTQSQFIVKTMLQTEAVYLQKYAHLILCFFMSHGVLLDSADMGMQNIVYRYATKALDQIDTEDLKKITKVLESLMSFGYIATVAQLALVYMDYFKDNIISDEIMKVTNNWIPSIITHPKAHRLENLEQSGKQAQLGALRKTAKNISTEQQKFIDVAIAQRAGIANASLETFNMSKVFIMDGATDVVLARRDTKTPTKIAAQDTRGLLYRVLNLFF